MIASTLAEAIVSLNGRPWARAIIVLLAFGLAGLSTAWLVREIASRPDWPAFLDMSLYLEAARDLMNGRDPYSSESLHRYPYPPLFAEFIALLVLIFGAYAPHVWAAASGAFLVAAVWLMNRRFGFHTPAPWILLATAYLLIGRTARSDLLHGQLNFMLLLLLVLGLMSWRARREWAAGALWALAICCKPFLGVVGLFLLRQREW